MHTTIGEKEPSITRRSGLPRASDMMEAMRTPHTSSSKRFPHTDEQERAPNFPHRVSDYHQAVGQARTEGTASHARAGSQSTHSESGLDTRTGANVAPRLGGCPSLGGNAHTRDSRNRAPQSGFAPLPQQQVGQSGGNPVSARRSNSSACYSAGPVPHLPRGDVSCPSFPSKVGRRSPELVSMLSSQHSDRRNQGELPSSRPYQDCWRSPEPANMPSSQHSEPKNQDRLPYSHPYQDDWRSPQLTHTPSSPVDPRNQDDLPSSRPYQDGWRSPQPRHMPSSPLNPRNQVELPYSHPFQDGSRSPQPTYSPNSQRNERNNSHEPPYSDPYHEIFRRSPQPACLPLSQAQRGSAVSSPYQRHPDYQYTVAHNLQSSAWDACPLFPSEDENSKDESNRGKRNVDGNTIKNEVLGVNQRWKLECNKYVTNALQSPNDRLLEGNPRVASSPTLAAHNKCWQTLLDDAADINTQCADGKTLLDVAAEHDDAVLVAFLLSYSADASMRGDGLTAFSRAGPRCRKLLSIGRVSWNQFDKMLHAPNWLSIRTLVKTCMDGVDRLVLWDHFKQEPAREEYVRQFIEQAEEQGVEHIDNVKAYFEKNRLETF